jgi:hypothetical protein
MVAAKKNDAQSDALCRVSDPDSAKVVAAWSTLPEPIRRAMLALIG